MAKNLVRKTFSVSSNFIVPGGVTEVKVRAHLNKRPAVATQIDVGVGGGTGYFLTTDGRMFSVGANDNGYLGDGTIVNRSSPAQVIGGLNFVELMDLGGGGITYDGDLYTWGSNNGGALGDGTATSRSSPTLVTGGRKWRSVASGAGTRYGLTSEGDPYGWGFNSVADSFPGSIGDNTVANRSSPALIVGGRKFIQLEANRNIGGGGYGLLASGALYGWGSNASGNVGDNTNVARSSPVAVVGGKVFTKIASALNGMALDAAGQVWTWGDNFSGNLGDGTTTSRSSPVAVIGGHVFVDIWGSGSGCFARKANGQVWGWGFNGNGDLGDGTRTNRSSPVLVTGGLNFVYGGGSYGLANDGKIYAWGANSAGQIGDNTLAPRSTPTAMVGQYNWAAQRRVSEKILTVVPNSTVPIVLLAQAATFNGEIVGRYGIYLVELEYWA